MNVRILFLGDIVGVAGKFVFQSNIKKLMEDYSVDALMVNGENITHGKGISPKSMSFLKHNGVDMVTSGNHIWYRKDIYKYLSEENDLLRPANFPEVCPGKGIGMFEARNGVTVGVINVQGRVFMRENLSCPIGAIEEGLKYLEPYTKVVFVDFHAEASAEKRAVAVYFDGKISALVGTHTHVQTADERILPEGTAFITDVGMCGAYNSIIGVKKEGVLRHFLSQMPARFEPEKEGPYILSGVVIDIDVETGLANSIERVYLIDERDSDESVS